MKRPFEHPRSHGILVAQSKKRVLDLRIGGDDVGKMFDLSYMWCDITWTVLGLVEVEVEVEV